jgi:hypothetical protein
MIAKLNPAFVGTLGRVGVLRGWLLHWVDENVDSGGGGGRFSQEKERISSKLFWRTVVSL